MQARKWLRRLRVLAAVVLLLCIAAMIVGPWYVKRQIVDRFSTSTGCPVTIRQIRFGMNHQTARGIRLLEPDGQQTSLLEVDTAEVELSIWSAIRGETRPRAVRLQGTKVVLRFDAEGRLLTQLPPSRAGDLSLPTDRIELSDSHLELSQQDRDPLTVKVENLQVVEDEQLIRISGRGNQLLDAVWDFETSVDRDTGQTSWNVASTSARFNSQQLALLPLVPGHAFDAVDFEFTSPVTSSGSFGPEQSLRYQLRLVPESYQLKLPSEQLQLAGRAGEFQLEDGRLTFRDIRAGLFGGELRASGELDVGSRPWRGHIETALDSAVIEQAPRDWNLRRVAGVFSGEADFDFEIADDRRKIRGNASGRIAQPRFRGLSLEPIDIALQLDRELLHEPTTAKAGRVIGVLELSGGVKNAPLNQLGSQLEIEGSDALQGVQGLLSLEGSLHMPLGTLSDPMTWTAEADLTVQAGRIAEIEVEQIRSQLRWKNGTFDFSGLKAQLDGGHLEGESRLNLRAGEPRATGQFRFQNLSAQTLSAAWPELDRLRGSWSGQFDATVPMRNWNQLQAWKLTGNASSDQFRVSDVSLRKVGLELRLEEGQLSCTNVRGRWDQIPLSGNLELRLSQPFAFSGNMETTLADLQDVRAQLPSELAALKGSLRLSARLTGQLAPLSWRAAGIARSPHIAISGWSAEQAYCKWQSDSKELRITQARANLLDGRVRMVGSIPFTKSDASLRGDFERLNVRQLAARLLPTSPVQVDGSLKGSFAASNLFNAKTRTARLKFEGLDGNARGLSVRNSRGTLDYRQGTLECKARGDALDGVVAVRGKLRPPAKDGSRPRLNGQVAVRDANLTKLARLLSNRPELRQLQGRVAAMMDIEMSGSEWKPRGEGRVTISDVAWGGKRVSQRIESELKLTDNILRLPRFSTRLADGQVRGQLAMNLHNPGTGSFEMQADRLSLEQLMEFGPRGFPRTRGSLSGRLRGQLGATWRGTGQVNLVNGEFSKLPVQRIQGPLEWTFAPSSGTAQGRLQLSSVRLANGRVTGELTGRWSGRLDLEGRVKVVRADVRSLARAVPKVKDVMSGRLSGEVKFKGKNIQSLDSFSGTFQAQLDQSQAMMLPVLEALTSSLGINSPGSEVFTQTAAKGRFRRGIVRVEKMTMESANVRMLIDGKLTTRGRLDLNVTADPATIAATGVVLGVLRPIDFLRRRLIFLHVGGSIRSPSVQPRTAEFIEQEIVLFFWPLATPAL